MDLEVALDGELFLAVRALEWLLLGVDPLVLRQLGPITESFFTEAATKLLLQPRLGRIMTVGQVRLHVTASLEGFGTQVAHKLSALER
jgi:hypothetical protein